MIKIVLEIKEETNKKFKDFTCVGLNVGIEEQQLNATEGELKGSKLIREKLGVKQKVQVVNECKNERINKLLNELFSI